MSDKADQYTDAINEVAVDAEHAKRLLVTFQKWQDLREYKAKEMKRLSEQLSSRIAMFSEAMNVGHSTPSDQILKLNVVEQRWQDLEDARTERKEMSGTLKDQTKAMEQKIKDLIAEAKSGQMNLFSEEAEPASTDGDEDAE